MTILISSVASLFFSSASKISQIDFHCSASSLANSKKILASSGFFHSSGLLLIIIDNGCSHSSHFSLPSSISYF